MVVPLLFLPKGEVGDTWRPGDELNRTGNNVWAFALTVDEKNGLLYLPVSGPGANYHGGDRPGANLLRQRGWSCWPT